MEAELAKRRNDRPRRALLITLPRVESAFRRSRTVSQHLTDRSAAGCRRVRPVPEPEQHLRHRSGRPSRPKQRAQLLPFQRLDKQRAAQVANRGREQHAMEGLPGAQPICAGFPGVESTASSGTRSNRLVMRPST